jgi:hypothetical protein
VTWVRDELVARVAALGSELASIENFDSFDCRGQNRIRGAKLSEHGRANALDIRSVRLKDGRVVRPADAGAPLEFRLAMKTAVCNRFTTVLGPGSDGYHEDHIHVDLAERHGGYRICHWDLHDGGRTYVVQSTTVQSAAVPATARASVAAVPSSIPLPRPRPFVAGGATHDVAHP